MPAKRSISSKTWFLWVLVVAAVWVAARYALPALDAVVYREAGHLLLGRPENERPQLHSPGGDIEMQEVLTEKRTLVCPAVGTVELNEETAQECFAALPLGPQDMAVLLNKLARAGVSTIGVSAPLTWADEAGEMARRMFCQVLGHFDNSAIGLRGRTAAQADFTPAVLRESAIPADNVQGDPAGLPSANRPLPNGLAESPDSIGITWAPDWLEDEPQMQKAPAVEGISFPLLMRWNGETIPTLPFRLALKHLGLDSKDVGVRLGQDIRFGGRVLPLDEHGRTRLTQAKVIPIALTDLVGHKEPRIEGLGEKACVVLAEPTGKSKDPARLQVIAATLSELAGVEKSEYIKQQCPVGGRVLELSPRQQGWWKGLIAFAVLALVLRVLPFCPAMLRHLVVGGSLVCFLAVAYIDLRAGLWMSVTAFLLAWVLCLIAIHRLRPEERGIFRRHHSRR